MHIKETQDTSQHSVGITGKYLLLPVLLSLSFNVVYAQQMQKMQEKKDKQETQETPSTHKNNSNNMLTSFTTKSEPVPTSITALVPQQSTSTRGAVIDNDKAMTAGEVKNSVLQDKSLTYQVNAVNYASSINPTVLYFDVAVSNITQPPNQRLKLTYVSDKEVMFNLNGVDSAHLIVNFKDGRKPAILSFAQGVVGSRVYHIGSDVTGGIALTHSIKPSSGNDIYTAITKLFSMQIAYNLGDSKDFSQYFSAVGTQLSCAKIKDSDKLDLSGYGIFDDVAQKLLCNPSIKDISFQAVTVYKNNDFELLNFNACPINASGYFTAQSFNFNAKDVAINLSAPNTVLHQGQCSSVQILRVIKAYDANHLQGILKPFAPKGMNDGE